MRPKAQMFGHLEVSQRYPQIFLPSPAKHSCKMRPSLQFQVSSRQADLLCGALRGVLRSSAGLLRLLSGHVVCLPRLLLRLHLDTTLMR